MTPKEKAEELFNKYYQYDITIIGIESQFEERGICLYDAKQLALITVDEIIQQWEVIDTYIADFGGKLNQSLKYWQQVKQEIQAL
jgi:hypothetical protein